MKRLLWVAILLTGCNTYQKQLDKFHTFAYNNPDKVAELCAKEYPCVGGETKSDTVVHIDTVNGQAKHDTVTNGTTRTVTVTIPKYITHTLTIHDTTRIVDSAKQAYLQSQIQSMHDTLIQTDTKYKAEQESKANWRKWCLILAGVIGLGIVGTVLKYFGKI